MARSSVRAAPCSSGLRRSTTGSRATGSAVSSSTARAARGLATPGPRRPRPRRSGQRRPDPRRPDQRTSFVTRQRATAVAARMAFRTPLAGERDGAPGAVARLAGPSTARWSLAWGGRSHVRDQRDRSRPDAARPLSCSPCRAATRRPAGAGLHRAVPTAPSTRRRVRARADPGPAGRAPLARTPHPRPRPTGARWRSVGRRRALGRRARQVPGAAPTSRDRQGGEGASGSSQRGPASDRCASDGQMTHGRGAPCSALRSVPRSSSDGSRRLPRHPGRERTPRSSPARRRAVRPHLVRERPVR